MDRPNFFNFRYFIAQALGLLIVFVTGCAVMPENRPFHNEIIKIDELAQIKRIGLLDVPPPENIQLGPAVSRDAQWWVGRFAILIENNEGNAIISGSQVSERTQNELKTRLEQAGTQVMLIKAKRTDPSKMLEDYSQFAQVNADAILEVAPIKIGFIDRLGTIEYRFCAFPPCKSKVNLSPEVSYKYRLILVDDGEVLIQSNIYYTAFNYSEIPWEHSEDRFRVGNKIRGPSWHVFENAEAVQNNPEEAVERLSHAIKEATKMISVMVTN